ncbi:MAG: DNA repair protein RecN [Alphaproteobacteria bacterium]|nr:DNA repair protein RecN [Alphaproteobacteria bacterium]
MLSQLIIHHFVLIDRLTIDFTSGFCALTGETGAGKSIILDALGLILGKRASAQSIRHGQTSASVTAFFDLPATSPAIAIIEEQGIDISDGLIIRRQISADGKSRAFINDTAVSVQLLHTVGEYLVEIHGQHDQQGLFSATTHRQLLDQYGQHGPLLLQVSHAYEQLQQTKQALEALALAKAKAEKEADYLTFAYEELSTLNPLPGEEEQLAHDRQQQQQWFKASEQLAALHQSFDAHEPLTKRIGSLQHLLSRLPDFEQKASIDTALEQAYEHTLSAYTQIEDVLDQQAYDPEKLDASEKRLFALRAASRKFQRPCDELGQLKDEIGAQLDIIRHQHVHLDKLQKALAECTATYLRLAQTLSDRRKHAATTLEKAMNEELPALKLGHCRFSIDVITHSSEATFAPHGINHVQFLVATNPGQPPATLAKVASGGELSRLMLAMKVSLTQTTSTPTLIFDEIDTGIGGAVADSVGKRLKQLSSYAQILVVTHQPQVCSYAKSHYKVEKHIHDQSTTTTVKSLSSHERVEEISRMLSGEHITSEAKAAAVKLLEA